MFADVDADQRQGALESQTGASSLTFLFDCGIAS